MQTNAVQPALGRGDQRAQRPIASAPVPDDPGKPRCINAAVLGTPSIALADAAREVLRMVDVVESMLRMFLDALRSDDRELLARLGAMDDTLDRLHNAIKLHLTAISREDGLSEADAKRCSDILAFTINLERVGDILDKSLRELAAKKIKQRLISRRKACGRSPSCTRACSTTSTSPPASSCWETSSRRARRRRTACATWSRPR